MLFTDIVSTVEGGGGGGGAGGGGGEHAPRATTNGTTKVRRTATRHENGTGRMGILLKEGTII
jgi:hypothetical protein